MELEKVDIVGIHAPETQVDVLRGGGGVPLHGLGGEENLVSHRGEGPADLLLAVVVGVRRVKEGDAQVEGPAEGPLGIGKG